MLTSVVRDGKSLGDLLRARQQSLNVHDAARLQELTYGAIRWSYRLDAIVNELLDKPLRNKDTDVKVLLWQALYEMLYMRTPDYAVVNSYAALTRNLKKNWARALVNGSLRTFLRTREDLLERVDANTPARHSLPVWFYDAVIADWGKEKAEAVFAAGNQKAPLVLRVNQQKLSRDEYMTRLEAAGIEASFPVLGNHAVVVQGGSRIDTLPGFEAGHFSVQDSAAQLAAELVSPAGGERVLDACAAPGGKTGHLLELAPDIDLLALDNDKRRLQRVNENLSRLNLSVQMQCADASAIQQWWDGREFEAVLLDAPCSALGVVRRHPDIRRLRRHTDIDNLTGLQRQLLDTLWTTVARGGRLVYATCSVLKRENEEVIAAFLADTADASELNIDADWGLACSHGRQILPGQHDSDGFYYAILQKR